MSIRALVFLGIFAAVFPAVTFAQIVPCSGGIGDPCGWSDLLTLGQNILNFIVTLSIVSAALIFAYAGFLYFTAGGDTGKVSQAHSLFLAVVIGLFLVLTAWLVVNTILDTLTGKGLDERAAEVR
ncbi:MAG: hypothetical protein JKY37_03455 [Nannocystaceae bacterium]|nr:hypothetical protein [Nannocystaceae bacterium]